MSEPLIHLTSQKVSVDSHWTKKVPMASSVLSSTASEMAKDPTFVLRHEILDTDSSPSSSSSASPAAPETATLEKQKSEEEFRNYDNSDRQAVVENHYRLMRENQTMDFAQRMEKKWLSFDRCQMTIHEAFEALMGTVHVHARNTPPKPTHPLPPPTSLPAHSYRHLAILARTRTRSASSFLGGQHAQEGLR